MAYSLLLKKKEAEKNRLVKVMNFSRLALELGDGWIESTSFFVNKEGVQRPLVCRSLFYLEHSSTLKFFSSTTVIQVLIKHQDFHNQRRKVNNLSKVVNARTMGRQKPSYRLRNSIADYNIFQENVIVLGFV